MEYLLSGVHPAISEEDNKYLLADYTDDEIFVALNEMGTSKAPGFD